MRMLANDAGDLRLVCDDWPAFSLEAVLPVVEVDGNTLAPTSAYCPDPSATTLRMEYGFSDICRLHMEISSYGPSGLRLQSRLGNVSGMPLGLGKIALLQATAERAALGFGNRAEQVVSYSQSNYRVDVAPLAGSADKGGRPGAGEPNELNVGPGPTRTSDHVWLVYDRLSKMALLAGFETNERFDGCIETDAADSGTLLRWSAGFKSNDLLLLPGEETTLESLLLLQGRDPHSLLDDYGTVAVHRLTEPLPSRPPVTWCSWYPYRLGVTEERILENARMAAHRLLPLGLSIIEADLGWEEGQLPSAFEENAQFPHGLKWLSHQIENLGFQLGCWKAPYQISEFDPMVSEHPEWLIPGEDGKPFALSSWFWKPHGDVYALDLTHPGARQWLRNRVRSLAERGIQYFKADFIGQPDVSVAKRRYNRRIPAGAATGRLGARIIQEELPGALILNCGGPDMPGTGQWPLLYACYDTGNTGILSWSFQQNNFRTLAGHLWKNRSWGIIQASCLCVGLPGTLEEARIRATAALLSGGQIDISDNLTTLPEDRWAVLEATLPPIGHSARAVDLFEPVFDPGSVEYELQCRGESQELVPLPHPPGSVWHLRIKQDWDEWDLVAVFALESSNDAQSPKRYRIPLERFHLDSRLMYGAYEFWSGQYLGAVPSVRRNPGGYEHPGDLQDLLTGDASGALELAFTGPAVKLLSLRPLRLHPWVAGTSFHQSCGAELADVKWDGESGTLSGRLLRPPGHSGYVTITDAGTPPVSAAVNGTPAVLVPAANGAWKLQLATNRSDTGWRVQF